MSTKRAELTTKSVKPSDAAGAVSADICVVGGAGHVGLPLSIVFASKGLRVLAYDIDRNALSRIGQGTMPFMEHGAGPLLKEVLANGRLRLTANPADLRGVPTLVITIGTPIDEFLNPTLKLIKKCIDELAPFISDGQLIVLRSTVYPGVTDWAAKHLLGIAKQVKVAFCPERIVQGNAIEELQVLPQIVSGTTPEAEEAAAKIFSVIAPDIVRLSPMEAEFSKLFSNAYRYIQFAVSNQFYMMATSAGVDFYRVLEGMKKNYPRMSDIRAAGFAAGPCLFKDTMQLTAFDRNLFSLGYMAMSTNEGLPLFIIEHFLNPHNLERLTVGLLGMAFKADSDDPRSSLSYKLKKELVFRAKRVLTTDPYVKSDPDLLPLEKVISESDIVVLCVPHSAYKGLTFKDKPAIDVWNFWRKNGGL